MPAAKRRFRLPRWSAGLAGVALALVFWSAPDAAEPVAPKLSPRLQELLREEMRQVLQASQDILAAQAMGEYESVSALAGKIADSFILEQSLTEAGRKELKAALPQEFVTMDRDFHETARQLSAAASARDVDRVRALFGWLTRACTECHSRFATNRFPGFAKR